MKHLHDDQCALTHFMSPFILHHCTLPGSETIHWHWLYTAKQFCTLQFCELLTFVHLIQKYFNKVVCFMAC